MCDSAVPGNRTGRLGLRDFQRERYKASGSAIFIGLWFGTNPTMASGRMSANFQLLPSESFVKVSICG